MLLILPPPLDVENVTPGETVRYPLLIVRGTCPGTGVIAGTSWKAMVKWPTADGRFAAAVRLKPGPNFVLVQSARDTVKVAVEYRPMTTPYRVRPTLVVAKDEEPTDPKWRERVGLALEMLQSACAEAMRDAGQGRRTFALPLGPDGRPAVRLVRSEATGDSLRSRAPAALYESVGAEVVAGLNETDKALAIVDAARWDGRSRTTLGEADLGGGALAMAGGTPLARLPATVEEIPALFADETPVAQGDTGLRGTAWAATATGMGAMLHELGHTFGLAHSVDVRSAMSRGFDAISRRFVAVESGRAVGPGDATHWDAYEAARLRLSPWFQPDGGRLPSALPPRVAFEGEEIVVSAPYGLGLVGAVREGQKTAFRTFAGVRNARLRRSDLGEGAGTLVVVDRNGNETDAPLP